MRGLLRRVWEHNPANNSSMAKELRSTLDIPHLPDDAEIFNWPHIPGLGEQPCVAYDFTALPLTTWIFVRQIRPELDTKNPNLRVAQRANQTGLKEVASYWWFQRSAPFVCTEAWENQTIIVPAVCAVDVVAYLPYAEGEKLVQP